MKVTRIYSDAAGESHFEDFDIPVASAGPIGFLSDKWPARGIIFRQTGGDYDYAWHNAPCRQFVIMLEGEVEIQVGDGTVRRFGTGDVLLVEDTGGRGHASRAVDGRPRKSIFVTLE